MKRLCSRFFLTAVSLSLLFAGCWWILRPPQFIVAAMPFPFGEISVRGDGEGWILQLNPEASTNWPRMSLIPEPQHRQLDWQTTLDDVSPMWLTPGCVYAEWNVGFRSTGKYRLMGLKHYVVIPALAITTFAAARWFRRRWPTDVDRE